MHTLRIFAISAAMFIFAIACFGQSPAPTLQSPAPTLQSPAPVLQSPAPILLEAASPAPADAKKQSDISETIRLLGEVKAQNEQTLKQQQAALEALDQLQKEADQIRILSKRG